ncbi:EP1-like glycoprotein 2 [Vitis vinifera]|uniref:EP1-like glycoprotein 2 n=1 Tax=Vitis vinifera TaxID=29760 RepID=A0A438HN94_VITVI|nr:EP1-like glycoprotein 2 [Vitis vinifera]
MHGLTLVKNLYISTGMRQSPWWAHKAQSRGSIGMRRSTLSKRDADLLAVVIYHPESHSSSIDSPKPSIDSPKLVWSANQNNPVGGKIVSSLKLTEAGDVVLFDANNATVWQSFEHPTDALLHGQKMQIPQEYAVAQPILLRESTGSGFICGFYCYIGNNACFFGVLIFQNGDFPELVWSANPNNPFRINATSTLELTEGGDLTLEDADGTLIWSTNTSGKSIPGLNLTEAGNLVFFDKNNNTVWQSFDYPTDCLVHSQKLVSGKELIASISASNWSEEPSYIQFRNESLALFILTAEPNDPDSVIFIPAALSS